MEYLEEENFSLSHTHIFPTWPRNRVISRPEICVLVLSAEIPRHKFVEKPRKRAINDGIAEATLLV